MYTAESKLSSTILNDVTSKAVPFFELVTEAEAGAVAVDSFLEGVSLAYPSDSSRKVHHPSRIRALITSRRCRHKTSNNNHVDGVPVSSSLGSPVVDAAQYSVDFIVYHFTCGGQ